MFLVCQVAVVALFSGVRMLSDAGPEPAAASPALILPIAESADVSHAAAEAALAAGGDAERQGDLARADGQYRVAWRDPESRVRAASALHSLHHIPGFKLPADEAAIERTLRALGHGFRRLETAHFVILSDCDPTWTQARARVLERTRDQFFRVAARMEAPVFPHRTKLLCVLFDQRDAYAAFAHAQDGMAADWVAGYYATLSNRIVFYNDSNGPGYAAADDRLDEAAGLVRTLRDQALDAEHAGRASSASQLRLKADDLDRQVRRERARIGKAAAAGSTTKATHEVTHLLAFNTGLQLPDREYPFWLSEGLATSFESDEVDSAFGPDRPVAHPSRRARFDELREAGSLIPLSELISLREAPADDGDRADVMYAQSFVLFMHLYSKDPRAIGRYFGDLAGDSPLSGAFGDLFQARFGDAAQIERRILQRVR